MYCVKKMTEDLYWVGASERRLNLFENAYPLTNGVSYNSYLLLDEKTVLIDTVDKSVSGLFFENVDHVLAGRKLDYLIVQHMEPDHAATIGELVLRHPEVTIVCNAKTRTMMQNFFTFDLDSRVQLVKEMDTLTTGRHTFAFVMAPMVHWPEVMVSYDTATKTLYSADAFGTFGALNGNLYADEVNFRTEWLADARRYYTNIVGKYGTQVQAQGYRVVPRQIYPLGNLYPGRRRGRHRLRLRLRRHGKRGECVGREAVRPRRAQCADVRRVRHASKLYPLRMLPGQPSGLYFHDVQRGHVRDDGKSGARYRPPQSPEPHHRPHGKRLLGPDGGRADARGVPET